MPSRRAVRINMCISCFVFLGLFLRVKDDTSLRQCSVFGVVTKVARVWRFVLIEFQAVELRVEYVAEAVCGVPPRGIGVFAADVAFPCTVGLKSKAQFLYHTDAHNVCVVMVEPFGADEGVVVRQHCGGGFLHFLFFAACQGQCHGGYGGRNN